MGEMGRYFNNVDRHQISFSINYMLYLDSLQRFKHVPDLYSKIEKLV